jgi:eukaryotic-like serine/threonine-protein kinase
MPHWLGGVNVASEPVRVPELLRFGGDFELDLRRYELRRSGRVLKLERIPMEILLLLLERKGQLVSRERIVERVWGKGVFLDTDNSINNAIRKIRQVLKDDPEHPRFIQTVLGRGYVFVASTIESDPESAQTEVPAPPPASESLIGQRIVDYRILLLLGGGGMGVVYKAEDLRLGRPVAMKFLPGELAADAGAFERLKREARAASVLDHPNICSIYQLGEHEGRPFIVMQLLEGETLRDWINRGAQETTASRLPKLLDLAIQITDGLEAAHRKGIIHRDIKPTNIFVTSRGQAKILDFGVAKFVEPGDQPDNEVQESASFPGSDPSLTKTGVSMGTPSYLSPEQVRREKLDTRTDLFSFGLVLYEMATVQRAFSGDTAPVIREAVLHEAAVPVRQLNPDLPPELERIINKAVEKNRDLRYQTAAEIRFDLEGLKDSIPVNHADEIQAGASISGKRTGRFAAIALAIVLAAAIAGIPFYRARHARHLTEQDTVVIADFSNTTGDPIFDETLKQALTMELTQSPFMRVASDLQVGEMLRRMGRSPVNALTYEVAAEVCQRMGGKAIFAGNISSLGSRYIVGLKALGCGGGETLGAAQAQAENKDGVLSAIGKVATNVRAKVGESLPSLEKYDFPVNATTDSLEALKAFSMGLKAERNSGPNEAIPFYLQAIELDPNFALAYATLGRAYEDFGEDEKAVRNYTQAFQLRDRLSEREKYFVTTLYYETVPGDLQKAKEAGELWAANFPRDTYAREKLGTVYDDLGEEEKLYQQGLEALRLDPESEVNVFNAVLGASTLDHLDEAERILGTTQSHGFDGEAIHLIRYQFGFQRGDAGEMDRQVAWAIGRTGVEEIVLAEHSETQAYFGRIRKARELSERATNSARRDKAMEMAADYQIVAALREIEVGNVPLAGNYVHSALSLASTRDVKVQAALALARIGNTRRARELLKEVQNANPANTLVMFYWTPAIEASLDIRAGDPQAAVTELQIAVPYELSQAPPAGDNVFMYPTYIRGQAYLAAHNGSSAAAEFKKILEHPGVVTNSLLGALARLQLARSELMIGEKNDAHAQYQQFLSLWKDADPDIPILEQAKTEYAKLQ